MVYVIVNKTGKYFTGYDNMLFAEFSSNIKKAKRYTSQHILADDLEELSFAGYNIRDLKIK